MSQEPRESVQVVFCLFSVLFLGVADNQLISPLLPAIRQQFSKSAHEASFLFTGYSISAGISVLAWGPLSDLFGRKRWLLIGLALFTLGSLLSFAAQSFAVLLAGRMVTGMAASLLSLNTITYAADYFPYERRGWAMGSIFSSYFAALILGVPLGAIAGDVLGWSWVFCGVAALAGFVLVAAGRLLPGSKIETRTEVSGRFAHTHVKTYFEFLTARGTAGALLCSFFASAGMMGFLGFVGVWLHDAFGLTSRSIGLVFLFSGAAALLGSPLGGALSDRIGKKIQLVASSTILAILLLVLPRMRWDLMLMAVFCGISVAAAFRQGPMEALLTEVVVSNRRGSFVALKNAFSQLGIGLAALASGALFETSGYFGVCLLSAGLNVAAASAVLIFMRRSPA